MDRKGAIYSLLDGDWQVWALGAEVNPEGAMGAQAALIDAIIGL